MTEEDIRRIVGEKLQEVLDSRKVELQPDIPEVTDDRIQWIIRSAFEEGWRLAGGSRERSHHLDDPKGWRKAWIGGKVRAQALAWGLITGEDNYK